MLELAADVDHLLLLRRRRWARPGGWGELAGFVRGELRREPFDLVLDFQGLLRSGLLTLAARAPRKVGFANAREGAAWCYTERVRPLPECRHAVARNLAMANQVTGLHETDAAPRWRWPAPLQAAADALWQQHGLAGSGPVLALAPGARWDSKRWPPAFFAAVLRELQAGGTPPRVCLLGAPDEGPLAEALLAAQPGLPMVNLVGQTSLPLMAAILARCQALLCNDSGPMHLAAALGCPAVALFGPTDPSKTGPWGPRHQVIQTRVSCAPCLKRQCPLPRQLCLDDVATPAGVAAAIGRAFSGA